MREVGLGLGDGGFCGELYLIGQTFGKSVEINFPMICWLSIFDHVGFGLWALACGTGEISTGNS